MKFICTQCGAEIQLEHDTLFLRCPFCDTALYLEADRTVRHYYMPRHIEERDLAPLIARHLARREVTAEVIIRQARSFYFPFWQFPQPVGPAMMLPAATTPVEELVSLRAPVGDLKFYSAELTEKNEVVEPEVLLEEAAQEGGRSREKEENLPAALVHLPFWEVIYECQSNTFRVLVEGVSGELFADDWPAAPARKKDIVLGRIALLAFVLFLLEAALIPWFSVTAAAYALTAAGIYYLARSTLHRMGW